MPTVQSTRLPEGVKFSLDKANHAVRFVEHALTHTKSTWSGQPFILEPWQAGSANYEDETGTWHLDGIVRPLFGAMRWSDHFGQWVRNYELAWMEMGRKNGKSELVAALGLYLLIGDGEQAAEIYSAAKDRHQAAKVFDVARDMIRLSPILSKELKKGNIQIIDSRKKIIFHSTRSTYEVVSADAEAQLGGNPSAVLFDEVLNQPNRDLWDSLSQGAGTRPNFLHIGITTAGPSRDNFAYSEHEFSQVAAEDPNRAPRRFVFMAYVDEKADWRDRTLWREANPGSFLSMESLEKEAQEAESKGDLSQIANFKIFRLNQWGTSAGQWLDMLVWDDSDEKVGLYTEEELQGLECLGGLDLADTSDLTAWVLVFKDGPKRIVVPRFFITRQAITRRHKKREALMASWEAEDYLTVFESEAQDYEAIQKQVMDDIEKYGIRRIGYDQFQAPAIVSYVENRSDVIAVKVPQTTTRMNPGAKELTRLMGMRRLGARYNPVLKWNAQNAGYKQDSEMNIKPSKRDSTGNIDGITALVNALVVDVTTEDPGKLQMHFVPACPYCGEDDIEQEGTRSLCNSCLRRWEGE